MSLTTLEWREPLWLLLTLVPVVLLLRRLQVARRGNGYADAPLLPWLRVNEEHGVWRVLFSRDSAYVLAWVLLAVALSGPRHAVQSSGDALPTGQAIIAVVDLSRSMDAADVLPDRRRRAVLELHELLEQAQGSRVGIVVFAGRAHLYVPPTDDAAALRFYLESLDDLVLPTRGSAAAQALGLAGGYLAGESSPAVVLLSDGDLEGDDGELEQAARDLAAAGIALHVLGIGTSSGEAIPLPQGGWLMHEGQPVVSRLDESRLQTLAREGGGRYQQLSGDDSDWVAIYKRGIAAAATQTGQRAAQTQWREHYPWLLLPALLLLFLAILPCRLSSAGDGSLGLLCLALLMLQAPGETLAAEEETEASQRAAMRAWQAGEYAEASSHFAVIEGYTGRMGEGASEYRAENFAGAAVQFSRAVLVAGSERERADALFNLGNSLFREGDYAAASQVFADVLLYRNEDAAARHNLALSKALEQAVERRMSEEGEGAARPGRGPRSARAAEGVEFGKSSSLSIDDSDEQAELPLPPLPDNAEALIARGVAQFMLANADRDTAPSVSWQQDLAQARLRMQALEEEPARVWQRLFEIEEGFPAPLQQPRNLPAVSPW